MDANDMEQIMTIIGTIGGFSISLSLVPQVYLTYKTKCADDISYTYQFIYIFGASLVNAYAIYFQLYAVYIPCLLELCMIIILTIMKFMYPPRKDLIDMSRHSIAISRHNVAFGAGTDESKALAELIQELAAFDSELGDNKDGIHTQISSLMLQKSISMMKQHAVHEHLEMVNSDHDQDKLGKDSTIDLTEKMGSEDLDGDLYDA
ncbi:unnamed protein product [Cylindrotheca closterium]|uniref:Uncharacterized protein n=1 Tax=Cylindrotheca closterium TaxID=2856 RepID=A0AAD2JJ56_9STRA|nr:unnamed protein product [Cylindrotheca closterium]